MVDLTDKQKECLIIINLFIKQKGYSPTVREIAKNMGLNSPATVYHHLKELKKKDYIEWVEGQARTIRVKSKKSNGKWQMVRENNGVRFFYKKDK